MSLFNNHTSLHQKRKLAAINYRLQVEKIRRTEIRKSRKCSETFIKLGESKSQQVIFTLEFMIHLLNADSPFPKHFELLSKAKNVWTQHRVYERNIRTLPEIKQDLKNIKNRAQNLHDHIRDNNLKEVEDFVKNNETFKIAYNIENQCALSTALEFKSIKVHTFLLVKNFVKGIDEKAYEETYQNLDEGTKIQIRIENSDFFPFLTKNHISQLMCKTRVGFGTQSNFHVKLFDFYMSLDKINWIRLILQIVASSKDTDIVFDFNHPGVYYLDPTRNPGTIGVCYKSGYILIGAKNANKSEVLGTIAHEFTHYAMQLLYRNKKQPFFKENDENRKNLYENTVQKYKTEGQYKNVSTIIDNVFKYNHKFHNEELIVRVPHLLMHHHREQIKLKEIKENFKELFNFYEAIVLKDLLMEASLIEARRNLKTANKEFHVLSTIQKRRSMSPNYVLAINVGMKVFVKSPLPALVLESFINELKKKDERLDTSHIFVNFEQLSDNENLEMLINAAKSKVKPTFYIIESSNQELNEISNDLNRVLQKRKIVFISRIQNTEFQQHFQKIENVEIRIKWQDLADDYRFRILKSRVIFQDSEVVLGEVIKNDSWLQEVPLEEVFYSSKIKLQHFSRTLPEKPRVYIEQHILNENSIQIDKSLSIGELLEKQKLIIISDYAGMGKTTFAAEIARELKARNQLFWVLFIDLKWHTKSFFEDKHLQPYKIEPIFFSQTLLKLESTFEQKLFEYLYKDRRIIFVVDGVDEISPNYKNFVINLLKAVQDDKNQLLVTTRPHVQKDLMKRLGTETIFQLEPFSTDDQVKFFTSLFQSVRGVNNGSTKNNCIEFRIKEWLEELRKLFGEEGRDFLDVPSHCVILAETFEGISLENITTFRWNIFSLYEHFIKKKISIWIKRGSLAEDDNAHLHLRSLKLKHVFQKLALKQLFETADLAELNIIEATRKNIDRIMLRVGIVTYDADGEGKFTHKTFAEYFAAEFILNFVEKTPERFNLKLFLKAIKGEGYGQLRKFMDDRINMLGTKITKLICSHKILAQLYKNIIEKDEEYIETKKSTILEDGSREQSYLHYIIAGRHTNFLVFILTALDINYETKLKIMRRFFYKAVENLQSFQKIWKYLVSCIQQRNRIEVQKQFLSLKISYKQKNMLSVAIESDGKKNINSVSRNILKIAKNIFNAEEFLEFLISDENGEYPVRSALLINIETFWLIWKAAAEKFKTNWNYLDQLIKKKDKTDRSILHFLSSKSSKMLLRWLDDTKGYECMNSLEWGYLLLSEDINERTCIHNVILTKVTDIRLAHLVNPELFCHARCC